MLKACVKAVAYIIGRVVQVSGLYPASTALANSRPYSWGFVHMKGTAITRFAPGCTQPICRLYLLGYGFYTLSTAIINTTKF